jgi:guanylate cyclase
LLLNILPKEIAVRLKDREINSGVIADYYEQVSVIFADVVNFTPLSAKLPPRTVAGILDEIFAHFDALVDKHGVEKIETVGDEYMAACGVPRRCDGHAQAVARLALDMCDYMRARNERSERKLDIRIGIHSGPVVGGVIGRKKFAFELFGDTVNTANRMQSHGEPGKIQVTRRTYELIKDDFDCEPRGLAPIKGKGEMETWFVIAARIEAEEQITSRW